MKSSSSNLDMFVCYSYKTFKNTKGIYYGRFGIYWFYVSNSYVKFPKNLQTSLAKVFLFPISSLCVGFIRLIKFNRQCLLNWVGHIIVNCYLSLTSTNVAFMRKNLLIPVGRFDNWNDRFRLPSMKDCCWQREEQIRNPFSPFLKRELRWRSLLIWLKILMSLSF